MSEKPFAESAQDAYHEAQRLAERNKNVSIEPEHLLHALVSAKTGPVVALFDALGLSGEAIRRDLQSVLRRLPKTTHEPGRYMSPRLARAFDLAAREAERLRDPAVTSEHLLLAVIDLRVGGEPARILAERGVTQERLYGAVAEARLAEQTAQGYDSRTQTLDQFGRDLTRLAQQGKLDPVIGRDNEIRRVIQILSRRTKNNPVLIGEPGVGKTAIVEGLAWRIVRGDVPEGLRSKRIYQVDLGGLVAGTKYRGEFEERIRGLLREIAESNGEIVVFIDEIHTIVGAGAAEGAIDASNMLKPMLARGELRCIGATTLDEYRKYIEKDGALERRFQPVYVAEPTVEDTIGILRGLRERYEVHHGVLIRDAALVAAAHLSHRYVSDRHLPDKAIDLVDEAAARLRMQIDSVPAALDEVERRIVALETERAALRKDVTLATPERMGRLEAELAAAGAERDQLWTRWQEEKAELGKVRDVKRQIDEVRHQIEDAERSANFDLAGELRYTRLPKLESELAEAEAKLNVRPEGVGPRLLKEEVDEEEIAEDVSRWTGIPVTRMLEGEMQALLKMEDRLRARVVGQEEAIRVVSETIRRARAGLQDPNRPLGSFIFLGPTGVGKTELARTLAEFLFNDEDALLRLDASEYSEKHSIARLIGAPPGYVGYGEGGQLTEPVRRRPYTVVLLDEIEKAHADVFNILLQILDDGRLTDGLGRTVDFKNTVFIMTSNVGSEHASEVGYDRPDLLRAKMVEALYAGFRPEFLNRVDEILVFDALDREDISQIVDIQLTEVHKRLEAQKLKLELSTAARAQLIAEGFDPAFGARPLRRTIQRRILNPLSQKVLAQELTAGDTVCVDVVDGQFVMSRRIADAVSANGATSGVSKSRRRKAATV
ncbi:MAG TPA: ATP-dependent chaperone ClpB [Chloroflexota bacterium]|nr:ATP-dependent chaperone ClpB [Chloroflexota bacterium]